MNYTKTGIVAFGILLLTACEPKYQESGIVETLNDPGPIKTYIPECENCGPASRSQMSKKLDAAFEVSNPYWGIGRDSAVITGHMVQARELDRIADALERIAENMETSTETGEK